MDNNFYYIKIKIIIQTELNLVRQKEKILLNCLPTLL